MLGQKAKVRLNVEVTGKKILARDKKDYASGEGNRERATVEAGSFSLLRAFKEALWLTDLAGSPLR